MSVLCFLVASGPLFAIRDFFVEIGPSGKTVGYHTKMKLEMQRDGRLLLTLPKMDDSGLGAWLVVCKKARGERSIDFRYEIDWRKSQAKSMDVELVSPLKFGREGKVFVHLTPDLASRSYVVFGGFFDDGTFWTVNLPAFLDAIRKNGK